MLQYSYGNYGNNEKPFMQSTRTHSIGIYIIFGVLVVVLLAAIFYDKGTPATVTPPVIEEVEEVVSLDWCVTDTECYATPEEFSRALWCLNNPCKG